MTVAPTSHARGWLAGLSVAAGACLSLGLLAATPAAGERIGPDLSAISPNQTVGCPNPAASCTRAQRSGSTIDVADTDGIITAWRVEFGAAVPGFMRLYVMNAQSSGGFSDPRRVVVGGSFQSGFTPNSVNQFSEQLPIHSGEYIGVNIEPSTSSSTEATLFASSSGNSVLAWQPALFPGGPFAPVTHLSNGRRLTVNAETVPPDPSACASLNLFDGTPLDDTYDGFDSGGDPIEGNDGADRLRGLGKRDCIRGERGPDVLVGGRGRDRLRGGRGNDLIKARAQGVDSVNCGRGNRDKAKVSRNDTVRRCEIVRYP